MEQIKTRLDRDSRLRNANSINKEELAFSEMYESYEKEKLESVISIVNNVLREQIDLLEYKENNNRTFASFEIKNQISNKDISLLKAKINKDLFHINIDNGQDGKTTLEIHLKSPLLKNDISNNKNG